MAQFWSGAFAFLVGLVLIIFNKRMAHKTLRQYYSFNYNLFERELSERSCRITTIIGGAIFMIGGLLMMINQLFLK